MTTREHQLVAEFCDTFGHPVFTTPTEPSTRTRKLRLRLMREEYDETIEAVRIADLLGLGDGLVDMTYIGHGTLHGYGLPYLPEIVQAPVGLANAIARYERVERQFLRGEFVSGSVLTDGRSAITHTLNQILVECRLIARDHGIPFVEAFQEVHASNMSKLFPPDETNPLPHPKYRADGKVLKGPNTFTPDLERVFRESGHPIFVDAA